MTAITVTIPGEPIPYRRAQGRKGGGRMHDDTMRTYLERVGLFCVQAINAARRTGIAWPRTGVRYGLVLLVVRSSNQRADGDNLLKSFLDGATGPQGLWLDDVHVDDMRVVRCEPDRNDPRLVAMVQTIGLPTRIEALEWMRPRATPRPPGATFPTDAASTDGRDPYAPPGATSGRR